MNDMLLNFIGIRRSTISPFIKNVMALASGSVVAQLIGMTCSPILTRIYGPEAFGLQNVFLSFSNILILIAALGYPGAIVLPKGNDEARQLVKLAISIAASFCLLLTFINLFWGEAVLRWIGAEKVGALALLLPVATICGVAFGVQSQWIIRQKKFAVLSIGAIGIAVVQSLSKFALWFAEPTALSLIISNIFATIVVGSTIFFAVSRRIPSNDKELRATRINISIWSVAKAHRDFPIWRTPQDLINALSQSVPLLLLAHYYGAGAAGHYGLATSILIIPSTLIGNAIAQVIYPELSKRHHEGLSVTPTIRRAMVIMVATGTLPFLIIATAGPTIFATVFGSEWRDAGLYAQLLVPFFFMQFMNRPAVAAIPVLRIQAGLFVYEIGSTTIKFAAMWIAFLLFKNQQAAIAAFSGAGAAAYALLILWVLWNAKRRVGHV
jgi:O-antigen/teichoic acid export membrane protein